MHQEPTSYLVAIHSTASLQITGPAQLSTRHRRNQSQQVGIGSGDKSGDSQGRPFAGTLIKNAKPPTSFPEAH